MIFEHDSLSNRRDPGKAGFSGVRRFATQETIGSSLWHLEFSNDDLDQDTQTLIERLAATSGGSNLFFEPILVNAAAGRIVPARLNHLTLFEQIGEDRTAKLAIPFVHAKTGFPPVSVLQAFSHPLAPLSLPLAEQSDIEELSDKFASLLLRLDLNETLVFEDFPLDELLAIQFIASLNAAGVFTRVTSRKLRAVLHPDPANKYGEPSWLNAKRRRENSRLFRKLSQYGQVEFEKAEKFWDVLVRFEEFLLLETHSWKGRKGSSIHVIRKTAAFARQAVADLAAKGRATIFSLRLDGKVVASLIMLRSANRYYPWKTAFDEHYRACAPGTQLMLRTTMHLLTTPGFEQADSLAREDSWMDRLWPERLALGTLVVAKDEANLARAVSAIERRESAKQIAKRILRRKPLKSAPQPVPDRETAGE